MHIGKFSAQGFRNLTIADLDLSPGVNIVSGDNAQGKTNLLEAIYFCAFGRSRRARSDAELIAWGEKSAHIRLTAVRDSFTSTIDACLEISGKSTKKSISADFVPVKHLKDLFGRLLVVYFSPEDLRLIKAGPSERRRFMDMEICQLSPVYYNDLREYFRALKQRNALLKILQKDKNSAARDSLPVWDAQLTSHGLRVIKTRASFVKKINEAAAKIHASITQGEELQLIYKPGLLPENFAASLEKYHERDIARGTTGDGIHTDDIEFSVGGVLARHFASQGQQRTAALSAKLAEIEIILSSTGETPVLLLDDVFSELDRHRQKFLVTHIESIQTIITCTGIEDFPLAGIKNITMKEGRHDSSTSRNTGHLRR